MLNYLASKILPPTDPPSFSDILAALSLIFRSETVSCFCLQYPRFKEFVEVYEIAKKHSWLLRWKKYPSIILAGKVAETLLFAYFRVDTDAALKKIFPNGNALESQDPVLEKAEAADAEEYFDAEDGKNSLEEDTQLLEGIKLGTEEQKLQVKKQVQLEEVADCTCLSLDAGGESVRPPLVAGKEETKNAPTKIAGSKVDLVADTDEDWEQVRGQGECALDGIVDGFVWIGAEE